MYEIWKSIKTCVKFRFYVSSRIILLSQVFILQVALDTVDPVDQVNTFVSIEGNLTESDSFFSSQPANYATADAFYAYFEPQSAAKAVDDGSFRRYHQGLKMATPEALRQWSLSSTTYVEGDRCGHEFGQLSCERRYLRGDVATPQTKRDFLSAHQIPNSCYPDTGHWLMMEQPEPVYDEIRKVIQHN